MVQTLQEDVKMLEDLLIETRADAEVYALQKGLHVRQAAGQPPLFPCHPYVTFHSLPARPRFHVPTPVLTAKFQHILQVRFHQETQSREKLEELLEGHYSRCLREQQGRADSSKELTVQRIREEMRRLKDSARQADQTRKNEWQEKDEEKKQLEQTIVDKEDLVRKLQVEKEELKRAAQVANMKLQAHVDGEGQAALDETLAASQQENADLLKQKEEWLCKHDDLEQDLEDLKIKIEQQGRTIDTLEMDKERAEAQLKDAYSKRQPLGQSKKGNPGTWVSPNVASPGAISPQSPCTHRRKRNSTEPLPDNGGRPR
eukprot:gene3384-3867_t